MEPDESILKKITEHLDMGLQVFVHRETFELIAIFSEDQVLDYGEDPDEAVRKTILKTRKQYMEFEKMPSPDAYHVMAAFIDTVDVPLIQDRLYAAIQGKRPFAHFTEELTDCGPYREKWFQYKEDRYREWIREQWEFQQKD